ncbi:MAG: UMP kinase [Patescibacteria group bacterium]|nr:UMP kinase [Patescibacteria group bacterium]
MKYKKAIIKLSGEALSGAGNFGFDFTRIKKLANELKYLNQKGIKMGIMIGGGNIFRGRMIKNNELNKIRADHMGMTATVLNAMCLSGVLNQIGVKSKVISAFPVSNFVEVYNNKKCLKYFKENYILVFAGGTGNPHFTTDTSSVDVARKLKAEIALKATQVDGVYDKDPNKYKSAKQFQELKLKDAIKMKLGIMDLRAYEIAEKNNIKIKVFKLKSENFKRIFTKDDIGTLITK